MMDPTWDLGLLLMGAAGFGLSALALVAELVSQALERRRGQPPAQSASDQR